MKIIIKLIIKLGIGLVLTLLTQIGGILYLTIEVILRKKRENQRIKKVIIFLISYVILTFFIIPFIAPMFGREKIEDGKLMEPHTLFTKICNRNYVTPQMQKTLKNIAAQLQNTYPGIKLVYLDANFPFLEGFPLIPHLSHNDGKKIDLSFIYTNKEGKLSPKNSSVFGYGVFVSPANNKYNQNQLCKDKGYWQYDSTKYLSLGITNKKSKFSEKATKELLLAIIKQPEVRKVFIEPHLKHRLKLHHSKLRFHGCQAVRHDDHIHIQL